MAILAAWGALAPPAAWSAQLEWIGGTDNSWHTPTNWAPIVVPGEDPVQRVPQDGDTVLIADTTHGNFVRLDGGSSRLAGLTIENGFELDANSHFLHVEDGGAGRTVIRGDGSRLSLSTNVRNFTAFRSDRLDVLDGGTFLVVDDADIFDTAVAQIASGTQIDATSLFTGRGWVVFGNEMTPSDTVVLQNDGTIRPIRAGSIDGAQQLYIATRGGGVVDFDGESEQGIIDIDEPGSVHLDVSTRTRQSDAFSGSLMVGPGDLSFGPSMIGGARIELSGGTEAGVASLAGLLRLTDTSAIDVISGIGTIVAYNQSPESPQVQMTGGSIRVHNSATLNLSSTDQGGLHEYRDVSVFLEDGSSLGAGPDVAVTLDLVEADLDGETGSAALFVDVFSHLTINAEALDNDPQSPGFDGTIDVSGGSLTVNVPGGWELDGRLVLANPRSTFVYGSPILVDGNDPEDGIFVVGVTHFTFIEADLVVTQNGRIDTTNGNLILNGSLSYLLRGDYNDNGLVEQGDLDLVLLNWGSDGTAPPATWTNDLPRGLVDQDELDNLLLHWGDDVSMFAGLPPEQGRQGQSGAVPEPRAVGILAICLLMMLSRRLRSARVSRPRRNV
jgi:hypothetical protein